MPTAEPAPPALDADELAAYVALALVPGIGARRMRALLDAFGSANGALAAPFALLRSVEGLSCAAATAVASARPEQGRRVLDATARLGAQVLVPGHRAFPVLLRVIPDPPPVLFVLGRHELLQVPAVAIVGSRDPTVYGLEVCRRITAHAVAAELAVVSGMARGLDAAAHEQALALGGRTIGVLGNGLGVVYPAANRHLYDRMAADGLLLTEFPPGERPHAGSFPRRNRLISGLAAVTVVVEAAEKSGALITAETAAEQGREVLAVPGPITSPTAAGVNRLLRDGAAPYLEPRDLLEHFGIVAPRPAPAGDAQPAASAASATGSATEPVVRVADLLSADALAVDQLSARSGLPVAEVLAHLSALELAGFAEALPGARYRRADPVRRSGA